MDLMLAGMTARQLAEWETYFAIEGDPEFRRDFRMATVVTALLEPHRDRKRRSKPFSPSDFLPDWTGERAVEESAVTQTPKAHANHFKALAGLGWGRYTPAPEVN